MNWVAKASLSLIAVSTLFVAGGATAGEINVFGGYFAPWDGGTDDSGFTIGGQLLAAEEGSHFRWGGEFEYRKYKQKIQRVPNTEVQDLLVDMVVHWRLFPGKITPYMGAGAGIGLSLIDKEHVEENTPFFRTQGLNRAGFLLGALILAGVEFPIGDYLAVFFETKADIWARLENDKGATTFRNTSGWGGRGGLKLRF